MNEGVEICTVYLILNASNKYVSRYNMVFQKYSACIDIARL